MRGGGRHPGEGGGGGLYLTAQQPPCWMFRSAALGGVFGFVLVVVRLVVFDNVVLATEESDHTWKERRDNAIAISQLWSTQMNTPDFVSRKSGSCIFFCHTLMLCGKIYPVSVNISVLTCPHDKHHHDDDELPCPQLGGLAHFFHCHFV